MEMSIMDNADKITKDDIKEVPHIDDIGARLSRDQIKKELASRQDDKKTDVGLRKEYTKRKAHAMLLVESNDHSIIVFKSIEEPWHKIGWNSALIYAYDVAIRACKKKELVTHEQLPQLARDTEAIREFLSRMGLRLHPKKYYIQKASKGVRSSSVRFLMKWGGNCHAHKTPAG